LEQAVRFSYIALRRFHFSKSSKITRQIVTITDAATRLKADLQGPGCLIEIAKPAVSVSERKHTLGNSSIELELGSDPSGLLVVVLSIRDIVFSHRGLAVNHEHLGEVQRPLL